MCTLIASVLFVRHLESVALLKNVIFKLVSLFQTLVSFVSVKWCEQVRGEDAATYSGTEHLPVITPADGFSLL